MLLVLEDVNVTYSNVDYTKFPKQTYVKIISNTEFLRDPILALRVRILAQEGTEIATNKI